MFVEIVIMVLKVVVIFLGLMTAVAYSTYFERKVVAHIQNRIGPNVTGPIGLLQPIADAVRRPSRLRWLINFSIFLRP